MNDIRAVLEKIDQLTERQNWETLNAVVRQYARQGMTLQDLEAMEQAAKDVRETGSGVAGGLGAAFRSLVSNEYFRVNYVLYHAGEALGLRGGMFGTDGRLRKLNGSQYTAERVQPSDSAARNIAVAQARLGILPQRVQTAFSIQAGGAGETMRPTREVFFTPDARSLQGHSIANFRGTEPYLDIELRGELTRIYTRAQNAQALRSAYPDATVMKADGSGPYFEQPVASVNPDANDNDPIGAVIARANGAGDDRAPETDYRASLSAFGSSNQRGLANNPEAEGAIQELNRFLDSFGLTRGEQYDSTTQESVRRLQSAFRSAGIDVDIEREISRDGDVGPNTIAAIERYREDMRFVTRIVSELNLGEGVSLSALGKMLLENANISDADLRKLNTLVKKYSSFWFSLSGTTGMAFDSGRNGTSFPFASSFIRARNFLAQQNMRERLMRMGVAEEDLVPARFASASVTSAAGEPESGETGTVTRSESGWQREGNVLTGRDTVANLNYTWRYDISSGTLEITAEGSNQPQRWTEVQIIQGAPNQPEPTANCSLEGKPHIHAQRDSQARRLDLSNWTALDEALRTLNPQTPATNNAPGGDGAAAGETPAASSPAASSPAASSPNDETLTGPITQRTGTDVQNIEDREVLQRIMTTSLSEFNWESTRFEPVANREKTFNVQFPPNTPFPMRSGAMVGDNIQNKQAEISRQGNRGWVIRFNRGAGVRSAQEFPLNRTVQNFQNTFYQYLESNGMDREGVVTNASSNPDQAIAQIAQQLEDAMGGSFLGMGSTDERGVKEALSRITDISMFRRVERVYSETFERDPLMNMIYDEINDLDRFRQGIMAEFRRIGVDHNIGDNYGQPRASQVQRLKREFNNRTDRPLLDDINEFYDERGAWKGGAAANATELNSIDRSDITPLNNSIDRLKKLAGL